MSSDRRPAIARPVRAARVCAAGHTATAPAHRRAPRPGPRQHRRALPDHLRHQAKTFTVGAPREVVPKVAQHRGSCECGLRGPRNGEHSRTPLGGRERGPVTDGGTDQRRRGGGGGEGGGGFIDVVCRTPIYRTRLTINRTAMPGSDFGN